MPKGFTLIEILIAVAIISLVIIVSIPNFRSFNETQVFQNAAADLVSTLRVAQNNAQAGTKCKNTYTSIASSGSGASWQVTLSTNSFTLASFQCQDQSSSPPYPSPIADPQPDIKSYPTGITMSSSTCGTVLIFNQNTGSPTCQIILSDSKISNATANRKTICVNQGGAISITGQGNSC